MSKTYKQPDGQGGYKVGKGKPPVEGQIPPGVSGNPAGPKKGSRKKRLFDDILSETLMVKLKGKSVKMTRREVGLRQLGGKIEQGDHKSICLMLEHDRRIAAGEQAPDPFTFDPEFRDSILQEFADEVRQRESAPPDQPPSSPRPSARPARRRG